MSENTGRQTTKSGGQTIDAAGGRERDERARRARSERRKALGAELRATFLALSENEAPEHLKKLAEELDRRLGAIAPDEPPKT